MKLNSVGTDFLWIFAIYQEQMRINKTLHSQITKLTATNILLRGTCNRLEEKLEILEFLPVENNTYGYTECCLESPLELHEAQARLSHHRSKAALYR